jgi:hypothetical protein
VTIRTAVRRLADRDISLMMMVATDDGAGDPYVRSGHADGLFLLSTHAGDRMVDALVDIAIPAVALGAVVGRESMITTRLIVRESA